MSSEEPAWLDLPGCTLDDNTLVGSDHVVGLDVRNKLANVINLDGIGD
jgi:hypothetical protein